MPSVIPLCPARAGPGDRAHLLLCSTRRFLPRPAACGFPQGADSQVLALLTCKLNTSCMVDTIHLLTSQHSEGQTGAIFMAVFTERKTGLESCSDLFKVTS